MRQANKHQDQLAKWSNKIKAKQLYNNDILITVSAYEFPNMEQKYDMMQMLILDNAIIPNLIVCTVFHP